MSIDQFPTQGKLWKTNLHHAVWRIEFSELNRRNGGQNYSYKTCVPIQFNQPYMFLSVEPCDQRPDKFMVVKLIDPNGTLLEGRMEWYKGELYNWKLVK